MAIAFRAVASLAYGSHTTTSSVSKPTGTVDGDLMVMTFFAGAAVAANIVIQTFPSGWTQIGTTTTVTESDNLFSGKLWVFWRRAASEGSTYTFSHTATLSTSISVVSYSGGQIAGDPVNAFSQNSATGTGSSTATGTGITTSLANEILIYTGHNWDGTGLTPPTGMTERFDGLLYYADEARATAGATSNRTQTLASVNPWQAYLVALRPASAFVLPAAGGSYAMTGTAATMRRGYTAIAAGGSYATTGTAAVPSKAPPMRAKASIAYGSRGGSTVVSKPTGTVDGDIMVMSFIAGRSDSAGIVVEAFPSGWTTIGTPTLVSETGGTFNIKTWVFWKRASSEGSSYSFDHVNTMLTEATIASYRGCIASGSPVDASSQNSATGTGSSTATGTGITTTVDNTRLVYVQQNWDNSGTLSPPSGMGELYDGQLYLADEPRPTAGATSNRTQTLASVHPWQAYLIALKPPVTGTAYSLSATGGSYATTGTAASTLRGYRPAAAGGSYAMTGTAATPAKLANKALTALAGSYAMAGAAAAQTRTWRPVAAPGSYAYAGTDALPTKVSANAAFRAVASVTYAQRLAVTTVSKPTGTLDGDIMILSFFAGYSVAAEMIVDSFPAGWTQIGTTTTVTQTDGTFNGKMWVFWKRASGEGASYDINYTNQMYTQAIIASYSGCLTTGSPVDGFSQGSGLTNAVTAPSITTTAAADKLVFVAHNWDNTQALTPPTGMTERFDGLLYLSDEDFASTGATGNRVQTVVPVDNPWQAYLIALKPQRTSVPLAPPPFNPAVFLPFLVR